jgi:hypothetical protein
MEQHYTCYPIRNDSASPEELQNGLRIGAPVRNGFLAAAWQVQATARLRLPNMHSNCDGATIPSRMWTLHFAAPANNSIHYLPLCGGCCCSKKDGPAMIGQKGRFRCCNRTNYKDTSIHWYFPRDRATKPKSTSQPNQHKPLQVSHSRSPNQPRWRFSRNGSAHERLLTRVEAGDVCCTACILGSDVHMYTDY